MVDFSPFALFMRADITVKLVMIILMLSSVIAWGIAIEKFLLLRNYEKKRKAFEDVFWSGSSIEKIYANNHKRIDHPTVLIFVTGMKVWEKYFSKNPKEVNPQELEKKLQAQLYAKINQEQEVMSHNMSVLATIGSITPFVGLFGTVWGIMNSFKEIAVMQNTSLNVVAPGIAEALFATALGLFAAIPALTTYNLINNNINNIVFKLETFTDNLITLLINEAEDGYIHKS